MVKDFLKKHKNIFVFAAVIIGVLVVDLVLKELATEKYFVLIENVADIHFAKNFGVAFSMLDGGGIWIILLTSALVSLTVFFWYRLNFIKKKDFTITKPMFMNIAFGFFIGGALGNLIDRIFLGYVRDFIMFSFWQNFPIFNFADICLNVGVISLVVFFIFFYKEHKDGKNKS